MALANAEGDVSADKKESKVEQKEVEDSKSEQKRNQRGVYGSLGDYGHSSYGGGHSSYGGHGGYGGGHEDFGGHDFGASDHHHHHVKTVTIEKKVPVPYTVHKHIPYTVEKKVPYEVRR